MRRVSDAEEFGCAGDENEREVGMDVNEVG